MPLERTNRPSPGSLEDLRWSNGYPGDVESLASPQLLAMERAPLDEVNGSAFYPEVSASSNERDAFVNLLAGDDDTETLAERLDVVVAEVVARVSVGARAVEPDEGVSLGQPLPVRGKIIDGRPRRRRRGFDVRFADVESVARLVPDARGAPLAEDPSLESEPRPGADGATSTRPIIGRHHHRRPIIHHFDRARPRRRRHRRLGPRPDRAPQNKQNPHPTHTHHHKGQAGPPKPLEFRAITSPTAHLSILPAFLETRAIFRFSPCRPCRSCREDHSVWRAREGGIE